MKNYDVAIIGMGCMGASIAYSLSKTPLSVCMVDQYDQANKFGSSHGESRIIRQACFEGLVYADMSVRSYELVEQLEKETNRRFKIECGGLMIGDPSSTVITGSTSSAQDMNLNYEILSAGMIRRKYPAFNVPSQQIAFYEKRAGIMLPEKIISAWITIAENSGIDIFRRKKIQFIDPHCHGYKLVYSEGTISAANVVFATGAWSKNLLPELASILWAERIVQHWYISKQPNYFSSTAMPIFYWDLNDFQLYGVPWLNPDRQYIKVGLDNDRKICDVNNNARFDVTADEIMRLNLALSNNIPALSEGYKMSQSCIWTMSPDKNFLLGELPTKKGLYIATGFSGRGFKFSPVVGEAISDLINLGKSKIDLGLFEPSRFLRR